MDLMLVLTGSDFWLPATLMAMFSYFCGCFNGSVIVSKYILRDDVRTHGSGNAGLTNFFRTFGGPLTLVVILTDVLKAVVAVLGTVAVFRSFLMDDPMVIALAKYWAALFCLLGHMFPCMFGFKGGKGILSGGTVTLMIDWRIGLAVWVCFALFAVSTRYVSLGSVCGSAVFPVATWFVYHNTVLLGLAVVSAFLTIWKHRSNIQRLLSGTENKFTLHKK